ncbi:MAG TPA: DHHA1 domain-containing protein, partial [Beijerinckiaceae bacterium]|nr:DHHA1 domain-containing protein [Beijerinckiaceae bacterium]
VKELKAGETGLLVLNQTPFYGESGGQVGDTGAMIALSGRAHVTDTEKKLGDLFVHHVTVEAGALAVGQSAELVVDRERRAAIRANHSATHLLHEALRQVLGDHVAQKGSLVAPDRLRFDFSHPKPIEDDELAAVEDIANRVLLQNEPVVTKLMAVDEAIESGARALFGEKYGDEVRVVSMGRSPAPGGNRTFSIELCGGTHVARTGDIGLVSVVSEGAVAAGVRRLEAMTGDAARRHLKGQSRRLQDIAGLLKIPVDEAPERLAVVLDERRKLERDLTDARRKLAMGGGASEADEIKNIRGVKYLARVLRDVPAKDLKPLVDEAKKRVGSGVVAFVTVGEDQRASIIVGVTEDQMEANNAVQLVRTGAEVLGGKGGGGRPDMAQAGGPNGAQAEAALKAVEAGIAARSPEAA